MIVKYWMNREIITADINASMQDAINLLKENNIRRLPIMKKGSLVGIVTDKDLLKASASDANGLDIHEILYLMSRIKIKDIMTKYPIVVPFDYTVQEAAEILLEKKISGLPVVDHNKKLIGIITQSDIFKVLISISGIKNRGISFAFQIEDRPGSIKDIADIIREYNGRIVSILTSYEKVLKGFRRVYIHVYNIDRTRIEDITEKIKEKTTLFYIIDHKTDKREIFP
ncbi:MAG: CBS domain-containing protein [Deltaproteobacteria bacterium]|nr:CBS domain-containing protein [Deltaproteobacteria bacterium]